MSQPSAILAAIQKFYPEYHPLVSIAHIAHAQDKDVDARLRFDCHRVIAKYVEPELKSLEVKNLITPTRRVTISMFDESQIIDAELTQIPNQQISVEKSVNDY